MASIPSGAFMYRNVRAELTRQRSQDQPKQRSLSSSDGATPPTSPNFVDSANIDLKCKSASTSSQPHLTSANKVIPLPPATSSQLSQSTEPVKYPHPHYKLSDNFFFWANSYNHYKLYGGSNSNIVPARPNLASSGDDGGYVSDSETSGYKSDSEVVKSSTKPSRRIRNLSGSSSTINSMFLRSMSYNDGGSERKVEEEEQLKKRLESMEMLGTSSGEKMVERGRDRSWSLSLRGLWGGSGGVGDGRRLGVVEEHPAAGKVTPMPVVGPPDNV